MSDIDIDPFRMGEQADRLRATQPDLAGLPDIAVPDTGETSPHASAVLHRLAEVGDELSAALGQLASDLDHCLAAYAAADGQASFVMELLMRAAFS